MVGVSWHISEIAISISENLPLQTLTTRHEELQLSGNTLQTARNVSVKKLVVISKYNLIQLEFEVFNIPQMKKNEVFFKNVIYMVAEELSLKVTYTSWN